MVAATAAHHDFTVVTRNVAQVAAAGVGASVPGPGGWCGAIAATPPHLPPIYPRRQFLAYPLPIPPHQGLCPTRQGMRGKETVTMRALRVVAPYPVWLLEPRRGWNSPVASVKTAAHEVSVAEEPIIAHEPLPACSVCQLNAVFAGRQRLVPLEFVGSVRDIGCMSNNNPTLGRHSGVLKACLRHGAAMTDLRVA